jgi:L-alanine-DL-glutamate epimerase-like enolase superfamily enzyme
MHATLYRQDVVLAQPISASAQEHALRSRLFLCLDDQGIPGYGEVAPQPSTLNGDPGLDEVVGATRSSLAQLLEVVTREGTMPSWGRVSGFGAATPANNVATELVEMALLDRELREASTTISTLWPAKFETPTQVTVSLLSDRDWLVDESVARIRLKSAPGLISDRTLERLSRLRVPVLVDFNCSATSDMDVLALVELIREVATISAVEQPFKAGNVIDHARLASRLDVPISIDEGVRSLRDLTQIENYHAAKMICVKPARVGGLANARALFARARELGLAAYLGGFFESPYARRVHRALAHSCVSEPSDLLDVEVQQSEYGAEVREIESGFGVEPATAMLSDAERLLEFS